MATGVNLTSLASAMDNAEFVLIEGPGSSHSMHFERTEEWLGHVREHLHRVSVR